MFYDRIYDLLLVECGLEYSLFGSFFADILTTLLISFFALLPIVVSIVILFACIKGVGR